MRKYYYAGSQRIAMRENGALTYLFSDHLGSTALSYNPGTQQVTAQRYKPWGEARYTSGTMPTSYQYTGQRREHLGGAAGLYNYGARIYDPSIMHWTSPDPIIPGVGEGGNPNAVGCLGASTYSALTVDYHENQLLEQLNQENKARFEDPSFKLPPVPVNTVAFDRYAYSLNNPVRNTDPTGHCPFCAVVALTLGAVSPAGWVVLGVTTVATITYVAAGGSEGFGEALYQAGEAIFDKVSEVANNLSAISQGNLLPKTGDFPYVPPKQKGNSPYVRVPQGGFKDAAGNIWRRDKSGHRGPHWDVEHPDGSHTNVDDNGKNLDVK